MSNNKNKSEKQLNADKEKNKNKSIDPSEKGLNNNKKTNTKDIKKINNNTKEDIKKEIHNNNDNSSFNKKNIEKEPKEVSNKTLDKHKKNTTRKNNSFLSILSFILAVIAISLSIYSFNKIRSRQEGSYSTKKIISEFNKINSNIKSLSDSNIDIREKINKNISQSDNAKEQLLNLEKELNINYKKNKLSIDKLLTKINNTELTQNSFSKNINKIITERKALGADYLTKQEVGYLLRIAKYKLQSEKDTLGAAELLKIVESKLLSSNKGEITPLIDAIRTKIIQLSNVNIIDTDSIIDDIKNIGSKISYLTIKSSYIEKSSDKTTNKSNSTGINSVLDKIGAVIASGVKYTPKDPNKINISNETGLIEKLLMQVDIKTAEFAVNSHNKVLLEQTLKSIKNSIKKYFADDNISQLIINKISNISKKDLQINLPNLSSIIEEFEKQKKTNK